MAAATAEGLAKGLGDVVAIACLKRAEHALQSRRPKLLHPGVDLIEGEEGAVGAALHGALLGLDLINAMELAAFLFADEVEVERLVIVRDAGLKQMRETGSDGGHEEPTATVEVREAQGEANVNEGEPDVASHAVEDATDLGLDAGQAGQLAVDTVEDVGHDEQQDARHGVLRAAGEVEEVARAGTDEDGEDGDHVRRDAGVLQHARQAIADGAIEIEIDQVLGLDGFQGRFE